ncbi:outer membrane protein assembly factor BamD [Treponema denticola]|uniref:outer membrane protein assembly factor BamD n=1 Tax=Treponema denticola TaxID=158 RepID=UPI0020A4E934|nr:outer membrane protein assembly factor BamD [Treponema denticola]UTD12554.1 outer membrane protein assembly factor BamD [Treponema denticola]
MKLSIRFILILFLIFIFFNSCASTKKNTGEALIEDKKTEDIAVNEPKTETDEESDTEAPKDSENVKNSEKIIIMKVPEAESVESVSDPKPVADKPALEMIVDTEDENETSPSNDEAVSSNEAKPDLPSVIKPAPLEPPEEKKPQDSAPLTSNQSVTNKSDKKQEKPVINSDKAPAAAETKPSIPEGPGISNEDNSNTDNLDKNLVNEEKIKDSEPARVFSEFPSTEPDESKEEKASRSVKLYTGQRLEVVYPGEGWVYLGESSAQKGIKYQQRKLQSGTSIFHFGAGDEGSYILNFSYFDVFSDNFISDSIAVHVEKAKTKLNNTVKAPDYKGPINTQKENKPDLKKENKYDEVLAGTPLKAESSSSAKKNENKKVYDAPDLITVTEKSESKTSGQDFKSAAEMLDMIRGYISEGNAVSALNSTEDFFKNYSVNLDEALFLRGQAYELNGPNKNVKKALEAYQTLTKAYPESKFWDKADARIRYIKKFYIDIK